MELYALASKPLTLTLRASLSDIIYGRGAICCTMIPAGCPLAVP
jgi:hypothetical protein